MAGFPFVLFCLRLNAIAEGPAFCAGMDIRFDFLVTVDFAVVNTGHAGSSLTYWRSSDLLRPY